MQCVVLVLGAVEKDCAFAIERHFTIPEELIFVLDFVCLPLLLLVDEPLKVNLANVAEEEIVESPDIGVGSGTYDVDECLTLKQHLEGGKELLIGLP